MKNQPQQKQQQRDIDRKKTEKLWWSERRLEGLWAALGSGGPGGRRSGGLLVKAKACGSGFTRRWRCSRRWVGSKRYLQVNETGRGCSILFQLEPEMRARPALAGRMRIHTLAWETALRSRKTSRVGRGEGKIGKAGHMQQRQCWNSSIQTRQCRWRYRPDDPGDERKEDSMKGYSTVPDRRTGKLFGLSMRTRNK